MSLVYNAGFRVGGTNTMTLSTLGTGATIAEGTYVSGDDDLSSLIAAGGYDAFTAAVKTAFDAATASTFTVAFSHTTGLYTISRGSAFALTFSTAADLRLRAALGFNGNSASATSHTSTVVPKYVMVSAIGARSSVSNLYEQEGIVEEAVSDGGDAYATALRTDELLSDWTQAMESKARTFARDAARAGYVWSWQEFFAHVRGTHPFTVYGSSDDDSTVPCYRLRADGASFRPQRVTADDDTYWGIPFRCRDLGEVNP